MRDTCKLDFGSQQLPTALDFFSLCDLLYIQIPHNENPTQLSCSFYDYNNDIQDMLANAIKTRILHSYMHIRVSHSRCRCR